MRNCIRHAAVAVSGAGLLIAIAAQNASARFPGSNCHWVYQGFVAGLGAIYKLVCY